MISLNPYVSIEEKEAGRRIRAHMVLGNQLSSVICTGFLPLDAVYTFSNVSDCLPEVRFAMWLNMDSCTFSSSTYGTKLISKSLKGTPLSYNATHKPDLHFPLYQTFAFYNLSNLQIWILAQGNIKQQLKNWLGPYPLAEDAQWCTCLLSYRQNWRQLRRQKKITEFVL